MDKILAILCNTVYVVAGYFALYQNYDQGYENSYHDDYNQSKEIISTLPAMPILRFVSMAIRFLWDVKAMYNTVVPMMFSCRTTKSTVINVDEPHY